MTSIRHLLFALALGSALSGPAFLSAQQGAPPSQRAYLRFDNDVLSGTDRGYTGGLSLGWNSTLEGAQKRRWLAWFPEGMRRDASVSLGLTLGQDVYTPDDIRTSELVRDDRPYAGLLYLSLGVPARTPERQDLLEVMVGMVGPASGAEQSQKLIHRWIGGIEPQGWAHQLGNEPVLNVSYERRWKTLQRRGAGGWQAEVIPHYEASLGNLFTFAGAGILARLGWNLPNDFGPPWIRPGGLRATETTEPSGRSLQLYAGGDAKGVARNLLLDGNTFRESHRVKKAPFTSDFLLGAELTLGPVSAIFEYVYWTRTFKTESRAQRFSSVKLTVAY